eukprot:TRINITY_DN4257_c0_g1_i2.p1 TRINITY_DN4257_c0_g1~~TRINITY_DN4257_c0_g1_i2.p1  ORF type:complete len:937 (-),score=157.55 TRINITY_DN4257_c0_g1_i2:16-2826(-)
MLNFVLKKSSRVVRAERGKGLRFNSTTNYTSYKSVLIPYEPAKVEQKWQEKWKQNKGVQTPIPKNGNFYVLSMFPYPSGHLHMGHARVYTISDTVSRLNKMKGYNVLHPMGWDAFGLPAENAAIDRGVEPHVWTHKNVAQMRKTFDAIGVDFDWDKEVLTCSPEYYKWTQWIFLKMFENGLAYQKQSFVNWDPVDNTVLANEQVDDEGRSWRSGAIVQKKLMNQWYLKITSFTSQLLEDLDTLKGWPEKVVKMQREWIGKSEGSFIKFDIDSPLPSDPYKNIEVFTTRCDTLHGATYLVVAPDYPKIQHLVDKDHKDDVESFITKMLSYTNQHRQKNKEGIFTGRYAVHPLTSEKLPIYIASYVIGDYATGALMAVPCHDKRDHEFAKAMKMDEKVFKRVIDPNPKDPKFLSSGQTLEEAKLNPIFEDDGLLINSGELDGLTSEQARNIINLNAKTQGFGESKMITNLKDWLISRQRYWGCPIPVIHCEKCGVIPVPENQLPVVLPTEGINFKGKTQILHSLSDWVNTKCPCCNGPAKRETDTMDTFVDSSWYYLRYPDANNKEKIFSEKIIKDWCPVDVYIGGIEHAILHLLYSRFVMKFLHHNLKLVPSPEPFKSLKTQGMVHGKTFRNTVTGRYLQEDQVLSVSENGNTYYKDKENQHEVQVTWEKMSKSKYNGVDPETAIKEFGADAIRLFMLFKAPIDFVLDWDINAISGQLRWLNRIWSMVLNYVIYTKYKETLKPVGELTDDQKNKLKELESTTNETILNVTTELELFQFNTAIAHLMKLSNVIKDITKLNPSVKLEDKLFTEQNAMWNSPIVSYSLSSLIQMLAPMAPHFTSELWEMWQESNPKFDFAWPAYDSNIKFQSATVPLVIQMKGKKLGVMDIPENITNDKNEVIKLVSNSETLGPKLQNINFKTILLVKSHVGYLINFVPQ